MNKLTLNKIYQVIQIEKVDDDHLPDNRINHGYFETKDDAIQYIKKFLRDWTIHKNPSYILPRLEIFEERS